VTIAIFIRPAVRVSLSALFLTWVGLGCVHASSTDSMDVFAPFEIAMIPDTDAMDRRSWSTGGG